MRVSQQVSALSVAAGLALLSTLAPPSASSVVPARPAHAASATSGAASPARARTVTYTDKAQRADDVVDSIGVNTHLRYTDTTYGRFAHLVKPSLLRLGVRHVRDAAYTFPGEGARSLYYRRLHALGKAGIRFDLITSPDTTSGPGTDFSKLKDVDAWTGGAVDLFEGPNEPDLRPNEDWVGEARTAQRELYSAVQKSPALAGVRVVAPSMVTEKASRKVGSVAGMADLGNMHDYFSDRNPETVGYGDNGFGSVKWNVVHMAHVVLPHSSVISTETGYYTSPTTRNGVSPTTAGIYAPRIILTHALLGISRTYLYELLDEGRDTHKPQDGFGLVKANGTPKPSYRSLQTLIRTLSDPGRAFHTGRLRYSLSGARSGVRHLLMEKRNGQFVLALWQGVSGWDSDRNRPTPVPSASVTLQVPGAHRIGRVVRLGSRPPSSNATAHAVRVDVGAAVTLVEIDPAR